MTAVARHGAVEAGGTKVRVAIFEGHRRVAETRIATTTPAATLGAACDFLAAAGPLAAVGIASFGPVGLAGDRWGHILATPKPGWSGTDVAGAFARWRVGFDTDVNAAAVAEARWGAARGCRSAVYVTVGTGIGGGAVIDGRPLHGRGHPEMGHLRPRRGADDGDFGGICPFHGDCIEGLASGPAIMARWGATLSDLPADHPAHDRIADLLGDFAATVQAVLAPNRIVMGGGVMATPGLLTRVRAAADAAAAGYFGEIDIVAPGLGDDAGLFGALALAEAAAA